MISCGRKRFLNSVEYLEAYRHQTKALCASMYGAYDFSPEADDVAEGKSLSYAVYTDTEKRFI